jgi:hypothetical protein
LRNTTQARAFVVRAGQIRRDFSEGAVKNAQLLANVWNIIASRAEGFGESMRRHSAVGENLVEARVGSHARNSSFELDGGFAQKRGDGCIRRYQRALADS